MLKGGVQERPLRKGLKEMVGRWGDKKSTAGIENNSCKGPEIPRQGVGGRRWGTWKEVKWKWERRQLVWGWGRMTPFVPSELELLLSRRENPI